MKRDEVMSSWVWGSVVLEGGIFGKIHYGKGDLWQDPLRGGEARFGV